MNSNRFLYFISIIAAMGGLMFGFDIAIISGAVPFIQPYFGWNELELGWSVSSLILGAVIGAFGVGFPADKYGRKKVLIVVALFFAITCFLTAITNVSGIFIAARIFGGLAVGAASVLSPMYIAEISPPGKRGMLVSVYQLAITTGILISYLVNYALHDIDNNWRWMFASGIIPSVLFFIGLFFIPESPRWLFITGKREEAYNVLAKVGGSELAKKEMIEIEKSIMDTSKSSRFRDLLLPGKRRILIVAFFLAFFVQVSGINTVVEYAPKILLAAGIDIKNALLQTSLIGIINFIFTLVAIVLIDKAGRRKLYLFGSMGMTVALLMLALSFHFQFTGIISLIFIMLFCAFFASCIGPVFWTLVSEIFPNRIRGKGVSFASFTQWIFNFLVVLLFPHFLSMIGGEGTFMFLAMMSFLQWLFTYFYVPETKGRSLEEIEEDWKQNVVVIKT